jgi:two-component system NtrC family sensor kinase
MGKPAWTSVLRSSISIRLFAILFLSILGLFFAYTSISNRYRDTMTLELVRSEAFRASSFIKKSLVGEMIEKQRDHIHRAVRQLGEEPGMEVIRVYNDRGEIRFSSQAEEIGTSVALDSDACRACHANGARPTVLPSGEQGQIYTRAGQSRVLGILNPIINEPDCATAGCHDPGQTVLGVLDVQLSLAGVDAALSAATWRSGLIGLGILFVSALVIALIVYNAIHVPAKRLQLGTEALAAGDLNVSIDLKRSDELGRLARSFNEMARNLKAADAELRDWSQTLEDRVSEKTAELESISRQMIQVERSASLGRLAATVAHELNNPLSGIVTYSRVIARKLERDMEAGESREKVLQELDLIRSESMRCGRIVKDLLTYARESPHEFKAEHLHELIDRVVSLAGHHLHLGSVVVSVMADLADDEVTCDGDQIVQALLALMINSVEAMPEGGQLTLRTAVGESDAERHVLIAIEDTGTGIPEAIKGRIFDPFFSTKAETSGVGLGLAVVYGIVSRHGGTIRVDSGEGPGTTFLIQLPREPVAAPAFTYELDISEWRT